MKKLLLIGAIAFASMQQASAQLISDEAFGKMMTDYYNFALLGTQTPTTGFKVETDKPSISVKGNIISSKYRTFITNLELTGQVDNGLVQFFGSDKLNTLFKANLGFNFMIPKSIGSFTSLVNNPSRDRLNDYGKLASEIAISRQIDTFLVIKTLVDNNPPGTAWPAFIAAVLAENASADYALTPSIKSYQSSPVMTVQQYFEALTGALLIRYGVPAGVPASAPNVLYATYMAAIAAPIPPPAAAVATNPHSHQRLLEDYRRLKDYLLEEDEDYIQKKMYDAEIEVSKDLWTWKAISWINVTASGSNANFRMYDALSNTLQDSSSFLPGVTISANALWKGKETHRFVYAKLGFTLAKSNSLVDLPKFNYAKETTITVNPGETLKSKEEGIAYNGKLVEKKATEFFLETYVVLCKWKIPGIYAKINFRHSDAWINPKKTALDLGIVWSIINNDKDAKNLLTIIPFVSWSNLKDEYKDPTKTELKKRSDLLTAGIKIGVPINLSK